MAHQLYWDFSIILLQLIRVITTTKNYLLLLMNFIVFHLKMRPKVNKKMFCNLLFAFNKKLIILLNSTFLCLNSTAINQKFYYL